MSPEETRQDNLSMAILMQAYAEREAALARYWLGCGPHWQPSAVVYQTTAANYAAASRFYLFAALDMS